MVFLTGKLLNLKGAAFNMQHLFYLYCVKNPGSVVKVVFNN